MTAEKELHDDLKPETEYDVQTGEEEMPESRPGKHDEDIKNIYNKARKNRQIVTREEQDENPDAEMIAKMVEEAQDEGEFEHATKTDIDLGARKDHVTDDEDEPEIVDDEFVPSPEDHTAQMEAEAAGDPEAEAKPEEAATNIPENKPEVAKNLDYEAVDGRVTVKVEGIEYDVPEADVISAGGKSQYQKIRASNQRFQKAATLGKALQTERAEFEQQRRESPAEGDLPATGDLSTKAEFIKNIREKILDAAIDGTESDIDALVEEAISKATAPETPNSLGEPESRASDQVVEEFNTAYQLDRAKANRLLMDDYSDIMGNEDLRKIAESKYLELVAAPSSFGRTAVEMARESGDFVRRISHAQPTKKGKQAVELEARRTKKRVLPQTSNARSKTRPPETQKPRSNRQYIQDIRRRQGNAS